MIDLKYNNIVCSGFYNVKLNLDILKPQLSNIIKRKIITCMEMSEITIDMYGIQKRQVDAYG